MSLGSRVLLALAAPITGWFVAKDSPNFGVVHMMVATFVLAFLCLSLHSAQSAGHISSTASANRAKSVRAG
jgi:hypothetical protein